MPDMLLLISHCCLHIKSARSQLSPRHSRFVVVPQLRLTAGATGEAFAVVQLAHGLTSKAC